MKASIHRWHEEVGIDVALGALQLVSNSARADLSQSRCRMGHWFERQPYRPEWSAVEYSRRTDQFIPFARQMTRLAEASSHWLRGPPPRSGIRQARNIQTNTTMPRCKSMFLGAMAFNQPIGSWNVARAANMRPPRAGMHACMHACMHVCMDGCMDVCMYIANTSVALLNHSTTLYGVG